MKTINKDIVYNGYFKINLLKIENSNNDIIHREQLSSDDAVAALVYNTDTENFIFVKQFRVGSEDYMIEIPAGKIDVKGESPEDTLKREVLEEIGYEVDEINSICVFYPTPGMSTEKIYLFYVEVSNKIEKGGGVDAEEIEVIEISEQELYDKFNLGYFIDGKTIMTIQDWIINYKSQDIS
tara:strand:- start:44 stop:586 length:543 start_codon:yes stop_codon:yes gene_type:complete